MKQITTLLILLIATIAISEEPAITAQQKAAMARAAEFRTFITSDGKEIAGRPTDFSKETNSVEIETADGSKQIVPLSTLSEKDQTFIQDWLTGYSLLANNQIRFTIRKKIDPDKMCGEDRSSWDYMFPNMRYKDGWRAYKGDKKYDDVFFELCLENKSGQPLSNIILEYCIYHQTTIQEKVKQSFYGAAKTFRIRTENGWRDRYDPPAWYSSSDSKHEKLPEQTVSNAIRGTVWVSDISGGKKIKVPTDSLKLVERAQENTTYPNPPQENKKGTLNKRTIEGKLLGIRCRVYMPTEAGNYTMVEFATPSSVRLKTNWIAPE